MSKFSFLHTADWHLGALQHPKLYREEFFNKLNDLIEKLKVEFVLVAGDIYDSPNPGQKVKDQLLEFLLNTETAFIFSVGNHDYVDKSLTYHSLKNLQILQREIDHIFIIEPNEFTCLSLHNGKSVYCYALDDLETKVVSGDGYYIGMYHGMVPEYNVKDGSFEQDSAVEKCIKNNAFDYLALGDIHKHRKLHERCWYPGTLVQKTFSCEPGAVLVEIDREKISTKSVYLDLPRKVNLHVKIDDYSIISEESIIKVAKEETESGQYLRLVFEVPMEIWASLNKDKIKDGLKDHCLGLKLDNNPVSDSKRREITKKFVKAKTVEDEVDIAIENSDLKLDKVVLKDKCKSYLR